MEKGKTPLEEPFTYISTLDEIAPQKGPPQLKTVLSLTAKPKKALTVKHTAITPMSFPIYDIDSEYFISRFIPQSSGPIMKPIATLLILFSAFLFTACNSGTATQNQAEEEAPHPDDNDTTVEVYLPGPETPPLPDPKNFEELLERYYTYKPPYAEGRGDLSMLWATHPENRVSDAILDRYFLGTPAYPGVEAEDTLAYYTKIKLKTGHYMLLTLEESAGQTLIASIFDEQGIGKSSMSIYRQGKLPTTIETLVTFMIFEDEHFELYSEKNLGERLQRDTIRYIVNDSGIIERM